jgi:hypothetical protein
MKIRTTTLLFLLIIALVSCDKNNDNNTITPVTDFDVTNTWECQIDGVNYSGSIDTSFFEIFGNMAPDTMVYCTGTSADKKANIHFRLRVNRTGWKHDSLITQASSAEFNFDTSSATRFRAYQNIGGITFHVEGLTGTKCKGRFDGIMSAGIGSGAVVKNGKFSFDLGKGSSEPKFLVCQADNVPIRGYINNVQFLSNTLIMDGLGFWGDSTFQLMVRTGSQVKPGVYQSQNGDVGFRAFRPSIVTHYTSDVVGNLTVTIQSVSGNIVEGVFSGQSQGSTTGSSANISGGKFRCRIKNYVAQQDSVNKWGFSESNQLQYPFKTWGGNILYATRSSDAIFNYVTVYGESDRGNSTFKVKLHSPTPLAPGIYQSGNPIGLDSIYFNSAPLNGYYYQTGTEVLACQVDSIDNDKIVGKFYGELNFKDNPSSAFVYRPAVRRGYFRAYFR